MSVTEFKKGNYGTEFVGPFKPEWRVTVDGYKLPHITAVDLGDSVALSCDNRFGMAVVPKQEAEKWLWFIANCMAVAAGYSCFGENSIKDPNPYAVRVFGLSEEPK